MIPSNRIATHPGVILLKEFLEPLELTQLLETFESVELTQLLQTIEATLEVELFHVLRDIA